MLSSIISRSRTLPRSEVASSATPAPGAAAVEAEIALLNNYLETLLEVFPGDDVGELRRLLATSSEDSRLYVVTDILLKNSKSRTARTRTGRLEAWEKFRSEDYRRAVRRHLCKEFRGLSKSTVSAVMAEHNFMYTRARVTLAEIAAKSWRASFSNLLPSLFRRSSRPSSLETPTGCKDLDDELHELGRQARQEQIVADRAIAARLNEAEHAVADALVECECCFGDYVWEETAACNQGHFFCHSCLIRSVQESVYGQGKSLLGDKSTVQCLSSSAQPPCEESVPLDVFSAVLPEELFHSVQDRAASECLEKSGLKLVRCPFCGYAEVDELQPYRVKRDHAAVAVFCALLAMLLFAIVFPLAMGGFLIAASLLAAPLLQHPDSSTIPNIPSKHLLRFEKAARKVKLRRRGTLFRCCNSRCGRESCINCAKEWAPFHKCYEKEEDEVRIYIEKAMADAVKRTCPLCQVSFVKSDGCNKLTCPCGYVMCYICRADIREPGYQHFCQHFRQIPGTACTDCDSCDLYANEDEALVIRKAAKAAEEEYWRHHGKPSGWSWKGVKGPVSAEVGRMDNTVTEFAATVGNVTDDTLEWVLDKLLEF